MSLTSAERQGIRIANEGVALKNAELPGGVGNAAEVARCVIDGWVSALIRLEGPEETAKFVFALQDRVVRGIRGATMIPQALQKFQPAAQPSVIDAAPEPPAAEAYLPWAWFFPGVALGLLIGAIVLASISRHFHSGG